MNRGVPEMTYERLSPLDAGFLYLEDERTPMHISSLQIYEGGHIDRDAVVEAVGRRLHRVHPLWEMWLIDGLGSERASRSSGEAERSAVLTKVHHCMWDGVSGADVHALLLDATPEPEEVFPEPWNPEPKPSGVELVVDGLEEQAAKPVRALRDLAGGALRDPRGAIGNAATFLGGLGALSRASMKPSPTTPLNAGPSAGRRYDWARASLDDFKTVKDAFGATVNDVVLSVVSGALRTWCVERGDEACTIEAMVPVDLRDTGEGPGGNRVAMMIAPLPLDEPNPLARLLRVEDGMARAKGSRQSQGAEMLVELAGYAPPPLLPVAARLQSTGRVFNVLVTNIPGPQFPLYQQGHRLLDLFPQAPLAKGQGLSVGVMSYDGRMGSGLLGDYEAVPDLDVISDAIPEAVSELLDAAEASEGRKGRPRRPVRAGAGAVAQA